MLYKKRLIIAIILTAMVFGLLIGYLLFQSLKNRGVTFDWLTSTTQIYESCPCCCLGEEPVNKCIYHSKGDNISKILENDKKLDCSMLGCGLPVLYKYCD